MIIIVCIAIVCITVLAALAMLFKAQHAVRTELATEARIRADVEKLVARIDAWETKVVDLPATIDTVNEHTRTLRGIALHGR